MMQVLLMVVLGVFAFFVFILTMFVGGNWLLSLLRKPKLPSEESVRTYRESLLNPRWEGLEKQFGQAIPERIKNLWARTELISRRDIHPGDENGKTYHIAEFLPADARANRDLAEKQKVFRL